MLPDMHLPGMLSGILWLQHPGSSPAHQFCCALCPETWLHRQLTLISLKALWLP